MMNVTRVEDAAVEPLTADEAKLHLRVDQDDEDALIESLIRSARYYAEAFTRRALITQRWIMKLDRFPERNGKIVLPYPPLQAVESLRYIDRDGDEQILTEEVEYLVDGADEPGKVYLVYDHEWPETREQVNAVTIQFRAGYGDSGADVPEPIKQAMLLMVGHWYAHREDLVVGAVVNTMPLASEALLWVYRDFRV